MNLSFPLKSMNSEESYEAKCNSDLKTTSHSSYLSTHISSSKLRYQFAVGLRTLGIVSPFIWYAYLIGLVEPEES